MIYPVRKWGTRVCQELPVPDSQLWFEELDLGLGVWEGPYKDISGLWLRWYDAQGEWVPTEIEQGIEQGIQIGANGTLRNVALNMLQEGADITFIARTAGLLVE
jgi:hypothetical protein